MIDSVTLSEKILFRESIHVIRDFSKKVDVSMRFLNEFMGW